MNWQEVTEHPSLRDLPFKIELNEHGAIVMKPVKLSRSFYRGRISSLMKTIRDDGIIFAGCAVWTPKGTKVADVAWASGRLWKKLKGQTEAMIAPEVCVEVLSMSNSGVEMKEKRKLYFERGAKEVWICDEYGDISFYNPKRKIAMSAMFKDFPNKIEI